MHLLKYFIAVLVLLMTHCTSFSKATNAQMEEIMRLSGLDKQIAKFPDVVVVSLNSPQVQQSRLSGKAISLMKEAMEEAYQPSVIMSAIRVVVADKFTEQEYSAMKTWYVSDTGIEITAAEARASTPQAMQEMMQNAATILNNPDRVPMAIEIDTLGNDGLHQFFTYSRYWADYAETHSPNKVIKKSLILFAPVSPMIDEIFGRA